MNKRFSPFILLLFGATMVYLSWQKWPDVLVDFGRELYVPWQLNNGRVLYRDITHLYGPLSHYFNSLIFKIFGTHLMSLAIFNIGLTAILTCLIYRIFLKISDFTVATATSATFLSMFAFSQYVGIANYNFVCPYSHEVTHGILLSFFSIYAFMIYLKRRNALWLGIIGVSLGLASLTKVEIFLAISVAVFAGIFFLIIIERPKAFRILKILGVFCLGFTLPIIGFIIYFSGYMPPEQAMESIVLQYKVLFGSNMPSNIFYLRILGIDKPLFNITRLLITTGLYMSILIILVLLSYAISRISGKNIKRIIIMAIFGIIIFLTPFIIKKMPWMDMIRPLPLVMFVFGICQFKVLLHFQKNRQEISRLLPMFVLTIFGFMLLLKMILNVHVFHYGFVLSMPATMLLVMIILYQIPHILGKLFNNTGFIRTLGSMIIAIVIVSHIYLTKQIYDFKNYAVSSGSDTILAVHPRISPRGIGINSALNKIKEITKQHETFVVFPEGVILNYLARRKNPCPYFEFTPPMVEMLGEGQIIDSLNRNLPDYIILVDKNTEEHGYRYFGQDYGINIFSWIKDNYAPIDTIGNQPLSGRGFGIVIMKRI